MERIRAVHESQKSITGASGTPSSPLASPVHRHSRSGSAAGGSMRRPQNTAAKAAAQRLAQVMSYQDDDDEDGTDEFNYDISSTGIGLAGGRTRGSRSPMKISTGKMAISKNSFEQPRYTHSTSTAGRLSQSTEHPSASSVSSGRSAHTEQSSSERPISAGRQAKISSSTEQPSSVRSTSVSGMRQAQASSTVEQPSSARTTSGARQAQANSTMEQPSSARYSISTRPSQVASNAMDHQPLSARASGRPIGGAKPAPKLPTAVPLTLRQSPSMASADENKKDKRLSIDLGSMNFRDKEIPSHRSATALEDEVDMLQEENEVLLEKLHLAEVRCEEAEERARQLEQQVANLGEGVGSDACELSSKEAALQEREAALRAAAQTYGISSQEVASLRTEAEIARDEATSAVELLQESENELNSLRLLNQRVMLTKEEIEELVMKRCWLARYWGLCVKHGIHAEIAEARHEFWSSFISSPVDVVLAAGQKAKEEKKEAKKILNEHYGEGNVEDMLIVEKGLGELTSLKVENAVAIAMARNRRRNALKSGLSGADELKLPTELSADAFELSQEESEDVLFKQAWLTYFWTRAKSHGLEAEIADERMQYWINRNITSPSSHDAVEVERGLKELIKLGIETQLWEASRRLFEEEPSMS